MGCFISTGITTLLLGIENVIMIEYQGSENSGVTRYEISATGIILEFRDGSQYLYDDTRPGQRHVEKMKVLAQNGTGLTTYVNQHVRDKYKKKLR